MILSLLLGMAAFAGDCSVSDPGLKKFFTEYVEAHTSADAKKLKKLVSNDFWETFSEFAPKKAGKHFTFKILQTQLKGEYCNVEWAITEAGKSQEAPAWFRLAREKGWKLDGISAELED